MEIMTLDEAIKHAEEVAEKNEKKCTDGQLWSVNESRRKCAAEHRQLAEWLKELKGYRSIKDQIAFVKRNIRSENSDYLTGYISALSVVEGMIAEVEMQKARIRNNGVDKKNETNQAVD